MCANRELQDNISERIVRQYLISKNFANVLDAFEMETRKLKSSCYHPTDILEVLRTSLKESNLEQLADMWNTLENTYFVRLDSDRQRDAHDLKVYFFRTFITQAVMNKRERIIREFFEKLTSYFTVDSDGWRSWYALPYITDPANHPDYCMFFTKTWIDILFLSMNNFLCIVFHEDLFQNNLLHRMEILESRLSENQFSQVTTSSQPPFGKLLDDCNELGLIRPGNRRQK